MKNIKTTLRYYIRHLNYTILNILGLALALCITILITLYIKFELTFDDFHSNSGSIYRVEQIMNEDGRSEKMASCPAPLGPALLKEFPEIEKMTRVFITRKFKNFEATTAEQKSFLLDPLYVDQEFLEIFSFGVIRSAGNEPLLPPYSIMITEEIARSLFGDDDPLGRTLENDGEVYTVTGILDEVPRNSHINFDALCSMSTFEARDPDDDPYSWSDNWLSVYILLNKRAKIADVQDKMHDILRKFWKDDTQNELYSRPLKDIHLHSDISGDYAVTSSYRSIVLLIVIVVTVLLLAGVNYANLAVAQSFKCARYAAMKKINGANSRNLGSQILLESGLLTFIAMVFGFLIAIAVLPFFNVMVNRELLARDIINPVFIGVILLVTFLLGFLSGLYPAYQILRFNALEIIKGTQSGTGASKWPAKLLLTFQFLISISLIIFSIGVLRQVVYLKNMDLGYRSGNIIRIELKENSWNRIVSFKQELLRNPQISSVSAHDYPINNSTDFCRIRWDGSEEGVYVPIGVNYIDPDFIKTYGLTLIEGEGFANIPAGEIADNNLVILNENAVNKFGIEDAIGKKIYYGSDYRGRLVGREATIVGVVSDFHYLSAHDDIQPFMLRLLNKNQPPKSISVGLLSTNEEELSFLEKTFTELFPNQVFNYHFVDDYYKAMYSDETKLSNMSITMTVLAIIIACLGVFGLVSYSTVQRRREVCVRKVLGAQFSDILHLFSREYYKLLLVAFIMSVPISQLFIFRWLSNYPYKVGFSLIPFAGSAFIIIMAAFITLFIGIHSIVKLSPSELTK